MYYCYVRKLGKNRSVGFATVLNGSCFTRIAQLFNLFETNVERIIEKGIIIKLTEKGEPAAALTNLFDEEEEVMYAAKALQSEINSIRAVKQLPPTDYSVAFNTTKLFNISDANSEIVDASCRFGFTIVLKDEDYDTVRLTGIRSLVQKLNNDKEELIKQNDELKELNRKIQHEKKQVKNVLILLAVISLCIIGMRLLSENLNSTRRELTAANTSLDEKSRVIADNMEEISILKDSITGLRKNLHYETASRRRLEKGLQRISAHSPLIITDCRLQSRQLLCKYIGIEPKSAMLTAKVIGVNGNDIFTMSRVHTIAQGAGTLYFDMSGVVDMSEIKYVVVFYNGDIIAGTQL